MSKAKILIVEDEFLIAKGLSRKLKKLGYEVVDIVASGEDALQRVADKYPDLVLMDIAIQGELDGIETATKIHHYYKIPVIYVTAYADDETLERAESSGSYGYILKPFKDREVHAAIKMALKKHREESQLQELLKTAESLVENKSRLLSIASHDLRIPLTAIQTSAELLQFYSHNFSEEKKSKHFQRIREAIHQMSVLLEDFLTLSSAESGKLKFNPAPLDVVEFCQGFLEECVAIATPNHKLEFTASGDLTQVCLDRKLLRHILGNLLSNAIKYSPDGGTIHLAVTSEGGDRICFRITDEGIGIPPEYREKLFEQFERATNVGTISGTGLGLSIVKQAVDLHGGEITLETEVNRGSTFTLWLPMGALPINN
ncbi:hybrid sensor histidine kinase/response regulator [Phormidium sp. CCY1219]|uniref:hybrid sensor histidine kinase/response regulator n=1 Tax=Phormidium sp. CCY1219 TaxID=2886104 RepID=UPI002D1EF46C|nr:ATP-binding protein [Phormidium sp. CCY1219]MEB3827759.1 response regulator [Phormidium sp. CCY1219]